MTSSAKREASDYQPISAQSSTAGDGSLGAASGVTRQARTADRHLDALAVVYAARNGVTFERAYDTAVQQHQGAAHYANYAEAQNRLI